jgi:hypothetical protein
MLVARAHEGGRSRTPGESMNANDADAQKPTVEPDEEDTEGHGLLLDADFYIQRKSGRDADIEREVRERQRAKESRPNKPERR